MPENWRLLTRRGCHLCDEFLDELSTGFPQIAEVLRLIDVDDHDDWRERYGRLIPVLIDADGRPVCISRFEREKVVRALAGLDLKVVSPGC